MTVVTALLGKSGVGKTFLAAGLGMALGRVGCKTLLVGADQKKDLSRSLSATQPASLIEALDGNNYRWDDEMWEQILLPITPYLDVLELGPSPLLNGYYANVLEVGYSLIRTNPVMEAYEQVLVDVTDDRFDAALLPLFADSDQALAVTDGSPESLFVLNRLFRAVLIGAYEHNYRMKLLGSVFCRTGSEDFGRRFIDKVGCQDLMTLPDHPELSTLRSLHLPLFEIKRPSEVQRQAQIALMGLADFLRGRNLNLQPLRPITDEEFWALEPDPAPN